MITEILTRKRPLSSTQAHNTEVANKAASVSVVEEVVKIENKDKWTYEEGIIKYVLPLNDRVEVAVEPIYHPNDEYDSFMNTLPGPRLYNSQFKPKYTDENQDVPMLQCFIPLEDFDATLGTDLTTLVGRHVSVKVWDRLYASSATLLAWSKYERSSRSGISVQDMFLAEKYGIEAGQFLKNLGYTDQQIEDYLNLTIDQIEVEEGVIRLEGEAYWDKDVPELKEKDIVLKDVPENLLKRNWLKLKDQLCHMPLVMFGGK